MHEVDEMSGDESAERALFARRARVASASSDNGVPDFASVLAEVTRRASDASRAKGERRGRAVAAASMTIACLAATVAAWVHIGDTSHAIVAEPDAGVAAPEAIGAANFSADESGSCVLDRSIAYASDDPIVCLAPATSPARVVAPVVCSVSATAPVCSSLSASCVPDVTCSSAGP
jgi:hypothetical protein